MQTVARAVWLRFPLAVAMVSRVLAVVLADGGYLVRWPAVALAAPPAAVLYGVALSQTRLADQVTYTYSLLGMVLVVVIAGFGAALGLYLVLGYAVCDFFLFDHASEFLTLRPALLVSYLLLAVLTVLTPLAARLIRRRTLPRPERLGIAGRWLDALLAALIVGGLVYLWTEASAVLIRPVFVWTEAGSPTDEAIHPLQQFGWVLALVAAAVAAMRVELERSAGPDVARELGRGLRRRQTPRLPPVVAAGVEGAFLTFLIGGLLDSWVEVPLVLAALVGIALLRRVLAPRLLIWPRLLSRVPMVLRLVIGVGVTAFVGQAIIATQFDLTQNLWPVAAAAVAGMLVMAVLLPDAGIATAQLRGGGR